MAKQEVQLLRSVRMPAERTEGGKIVKAGGIITEASELDAKTLKAMAAKGYVAGMEAEAEEASGEESAPRKATKKGK